MRPLAVAAVLALAFSGSGCGHQIGDSCSTNVDCQPDGTRFCDTSAPGGYCTIDGCDNGTCPDEATCIRFLTPIANEPCTVPPSFDSHGKPSPEPISQLDCPHVDEFCVCDKTVNKECQGSSPNGHCAPQSTERRWCQLKCGSNSDCRTGYECRASGTFGAEPVPTLTNQAGTPTKICTPAAPKPEADLGKLEADLGSK
jgi:hypothetical protein